MKLEEIVDNIRFNWVTCKISFFTGSFVGLIIGLILGSQ